MLRAGWAEQGGVVVVVEVGGKARWWLTVELAGGHGRASGVAVFQDRWCWRYYLCPVCCCLVCLVGYQAQIAAVWPAMMIINLVVYISSFINTHTHAHASSTSRAGASVLLYGHRRRVP